MIRPVNLAWLYTATAKTLHSINDRHDLRPHLRQWSGLNDNGVAPGGVA